MAYGEAKAIHTRLGQLSDIKSFLKEIDKWMRRRIRMIYWKQWRKLKTRFERLQKLGLGERGRSPTQEKAIGARQ
ncbi:MAG: hypothetical protein LBV08_02645 [Clostridiales bacterium]|nr:hypothetical protein [Clostridiales bacterium]